MKKIAERAGVGVGGWGWGELGMLTGVGGGTCTMTASIARLVALRTQSGERMVTERDTPMATTAPGSSSSCETNASRRVSKMQRCCAQS